MTRRGISGQYEIEYLVKGQPITTLLGSPITNTLQLDLSYVNQLNDMSGDITLYNSYSNFMFDPSRNTTILHGEPDNSASYIIIDTSDSNTLFTLH